MEYPETQAMREALEAILTMCEENLASSSLVTRHIVSADAVATIAREALEQQADWTPAAS